MAKGFYEPLFGVTNWSTRNVTHMRLNDDRKNISIAHHVIKSGIFVDLLIFRYSFRRRLSEGDGEKEQEIIQET